MVEISPLACPSSLIVQVQLEAMNNNMTDLIGESRKFRQDLEKQLQQKREIGENSRQTAP